MFEMGDRIDEMIDTFGRCEEAELTDKMESLIVTYIINKVKTQKLLKSAKTKREYFMNLLRLKAIALSLEESIQEATKEWERRFGNGEENGNEQ